jgi:hypothetical protein
VDIDWLDWLTVRVVPFWLIVPCPAVMTPPVGNGEAQAAQLQSAAPARANACAAVARPDSPDADVGGTASTARSVPVPEPLPFALLDSATGTSMPRRLLKIVRYLLRFNLILQ